jgi:hypothetical protein
MELKPPWEFDNPLCSEIGTHYYYLEEEDPDYNKTNIDKAKSLCAQCGHKFECLEWGIAKERFGIWGGLNPKERSLVRRRRKVKISLEELYAARRE